MNNKKDKLFQTLINTENAVQKVMSKGREIVKEGQFVTDIIACNKEFICQFPDDSVLSSKQWDDQISAWDSLSRYMDVVLSDLDQTSQFLPVAVSSTSSSTSPMISWEHIQLLPVSAQDTARKTYEKYEQIIEKSNPISNIESEIHRIGLASQVVGRETTLSLLIQSRQAFQVPTFEVVSPAAVLIPLREAINVTVAELLTKRPQQKKSTNLQDKIRSICNQCCKSALDEKQIAQLGGKKLTT